MKLFGALALGCLIVGLGGCRVSSGSGTLARGDANDCTSNWREINYQAAPFPDTAARYFSFAYEMPRQDDIVLRVAAKFPVARYMSYHVYNWVNESSLATIYDAQLEPNGTSTQNPYRPGADRYAPTAEYEAWAGCGEGAVLAGKRNRLPINCGAGPAVKLDMWYRVYLSESDIEMPRVTAWNARTGEPAACPKPLLKEWSIATRELKIGGGMREPMEVILGRVPPPFMDGQVAFYRPESTALGANDQINYLSTRLDGKAIGGGGSWSGAMGKVLENTFLKSRGVIWKIGDVTVLKFKVPTTPKQSPNAKLPSFLPTDDMRYWSLCVSGETTDTSNCINDSDALTMESPAGRIAVVVVGPDKFALQEGCRVRGWNYLKHDKHRAPVLFFRQMLTRTTPPFAGDMAQVARIRKVDFPAETSPSVEIVGKFFAQRVMGEFAPVGRQCYFGPDFFGSLCGMKL